MELKLNSRKMILPHNEQILSSNCIINAPHCPRNLAMMACKQVLFLGAATMVVVCALWRRKCESNSIVQRRIFHAIEGCSSWKTILSQTHPAN